jgi:hypothetical protein
MGSMITIFNFIKEHYFKLFLLLCLIVLFILVWFKGININNINNNHQEQFQYQSQMSINLFVSSGQVDWKYKQIGETIDDYCRERSKLPPEQSYFSERVIEYGFFKNKYYFIYPEFRNR